MWPSALTIASFSPVFFCASASRFLYGFRSVKFSGSVERRSRSTSS